MRIHLILPGGVARPGENADIPAICALIERLAARHEVTVFLLRQYPAPCAYTRLGARVVNLGAVPRGLGRVSGWVRRRRLVRALRGRPAPDIVHAFWIGPASDLALGHPAAATVPRVVSIAGGELVALEQIGYGGLRAPEGRLAAARAFAGADAVLAGSAAMLAHVPIGAKRRMLCPLYPESALFARKSPGEANHVLTVSNVNAVKDPDTLLRAFAHAVQRVPSAQLTWCGLDTLDGMAHRLAASLEIADRVTFTGLLRYEELPARYHAAQVYVQASCHEGQGVAVCEAAAAGLAIVGTAVGILPELAEAGAAVAVPPGDAEALGDALAALLLDAPARERLTENAAAWAAPRTAETTAQAVETLYRELLAERGV